MSQLNTGIQLKNYLQNALSFSLLCQRYQNRNRQRSIKYHRFFLAAPCFYLFSTEHMSSNKYRNNFIDVFLLFLSTNNAVIENDVLRKLTKNRWEFFSYSLSKGPFTPLTLMLTFERKTQISFATFTLMSVLARSPHRESLVLAYHWHKNQTGAGLTEKRQR